MKNLLTKIPIFFIFTLILSIIPACEGEKRIPYVNVNIIIYPDLPEYNTIKTPGNHIYITGGYAGIILYCISADTYIAYERNCPHNYSNNNAILDVDSTNMFMVCRDCSSKFTITDGSKLEGPSKNPIIIYKTTLNNNALHIYNY